MITISAKTLDEAITKALIELRTTSDHLYYEIVEKGSNGLFGIIGTKPYVIRARVKTESEEKQDSKKETEKAEKIETQAPEKVKKVPLKEEIKKTPVSTSENKKPIKRTEKKEYTEVKNVVAADPEAVQKKAKDFLNQIFNAMGITVLIETSYQSGDGELLITMSGEDMGILIGKRGQTLDSLQYLVSLVVNKETEGYLRVKLDTENYRERRKETLETLAKNIAYKVKRTKRPVSLEPMNPYERRIIHSALQNDKLINTRSEGEDPFRHVVVSLKRENHRK